MMISLAILAVFIWLRDLAWVSTSDDTLPILVALPLFVWIGVPWNFRSEYESPSLTSLVWAIVIFVAGIALNMTFLLALGWTILLWSWLSVRIEEKRRSDLIKLLVLPLFAFPWIALDADRIGWWFRLSGAWATAHVFSAAGFQVEQQGTNLLIDHLPISVEVACAGLNTLQSMLIAGTFVNYTIAGHTFYYWLNIPVLFLMSWVSNTIRIIGISAAALAVSSEFALGPFHIWGGWAILVIMFALCWVLFSLEVRGSNKSKMDPHAH